MFKIVYYLFLFLFSICEIVLIVYLHKKLITVIILLVATLGFFLVLMFSYGFYIIADKIEEIEKSQKKK